MSERIEDYALIGDLQTAALVGKDGSIDWLCFPRFDSGACFAALLGGPENGRWKIAPADEVRSVRRAYRDGSLVLDTEFTTDTGAVRLTDCMPVRTRVPDVLRLVEGLRGEVRMRMELVIRFDYGSIVPWLQHDPDDDEYSLRAIAGPDMVRLRSPVPTRGEDFHTVAEFTVKAGQRFPFDLTWYPSHHPEPAEKDIELGVDHAEQWWRDWADRCAYDGPDRGAVLRSLITLKAMIYEPTGGIVAAPTSSLPEFLGGVRNWDYRYCWLRDSTFTLLALMGAGYHNEARAWREWLLRAVAGKPSQMQILYGVAGERRLQEYTVPWLSGFEASCPVRIGNAASQQFQLDVYGEVMDSLHHTRLTGLEPLGPSWDLQLALLEFLETGWQRPDEGIWEVRGPRRHFTHSKMMAWVAFDRAVKAVEKFQLDGPADRWRALRDEVHEQVCREGFDPELNAFVQHYGSKHLDASLLMMPLVGFLPATDPRVCGTVALIEQRLLRDGFVLRYDTGSDVDGLPAGEGAFLPCTFWLADNYTLMGRHDEARATFDRLLSIRNDVGLLAEEYDPHRGRQLGNFPQAFSHIGLVNTAYTLARANKGSTVPPREG